LGRQSELRGAVVGRLAEPASKAQLAAYDGLWRP
jgi:hypothetical protein